MRILFKFPSRERPTKVFKTIANITSLAKNDDYFIWLTLDIDDPSMCNPEVRDRIAQYDKVKSMYGTSLSKIHAINRDMEFTGDWDICVVMSDDMVWTREGFDKIIIEAFEKHFPDLDGVVHIPDQKAGSALITLSILGRKYYERFGYLYNFEYASVYADNEFTEVAKLLSKYLLIKEPMLIHEHSIWGFGEPDALLKRTEDPNIYAKDRAIYFRRKMNNFDL